MIRKALLLVALCLAPLSGFSQGGVNPPQPGSNVPPAPSMWWNGSSWLASSSGNPFPVQCVSGCSAAGSFTDNSAFTVSTSSISPVGAYFTSGADPACTTGNACRLRIDSASNLRVNCIVGCAGGSTTPADAFANPTTAGLQFDLLAGFNGTTWDRLRVDGSKNLLVALNAAIPAGTNTIGAVNQTKPTAGYGVILDSAGTNVATVKAASTAAAATDTALVVAVSPNNSVAVTGTFFQTTQPVSCAVANCAVSVNNWAGSVLGAIANYGTSPGAVLVPGVNAFITNTPNVNIQANATVDIFGHTGGILDAATNAAPPANGVQPIFVSATALPAAVTATNTVAPMADKFGRQTTLPVAMRDLIKMASVQTTNNTLTTLLASQGAGIFADLINLYIGTETGTACTVSLTDGTTTYKIDVAATIGAGVVFPGDDVPIPQAGSATAWSVTGCTSVTLDYTAKFALNK